MCAKKTTLSFKLNLILSIALACVLSAAVVFAIRAFRPVTFLIFVEDEIYEKYFAPAPLYSDESKIFFVKNSDKNTFTESFFGPVYKTAGFIEPHKEIALLPQNYEDNQRFFVLFEEELLPSVPADFKNTSSVKNSINSPELSITFSDLNNLPQGNRAIPVDNIYADDENYLLKVKNGILCTVTEEEISEKVFGYCQKIFPEKKNENSDRLVTIAGVGDIMVARGVQEILIEDEDGIQKVFDDTLPILQNADFTIGNLEGVVTDSWQNAIKTYTFKFKKKVLPKLTEAGFDYLMQTNNHCYDYGESGFKDTLKAFEEYKIPSSGIGKNAEEAEKFYHTTIKNLPISVISCGAFPVERSGFDGEKTATATDKRAGILWKSEELLERIKAEKEAGYFVIVNIHGGEEYYFSPTKKQREYYEKLCDNGADVVFGSHPHVLQPTEWHNNSLIVFSLGNFIFNGMEDMKGGTDSEIVKIGVLDGKIAYVEQYPVTIKNNGVQLKK